MVKKSVRERNKWSRESFTRPESFLFINNLSLHHYIHTLYHECPLTPFRYFFSVDWLFFCGSNWVRKNKKSLWQCFPNHQYNPVYFEYVYTYPSCVFSLSLKYLLFLSQAIATRTNPIIRTSELEERERKKFFFNNHKNLNYVRWSSATSPSPCTYKCHPCPCDKFCFLYHSSTTISVSSICIFISGIWPLSPKASWFQTSELFLFFPKIHIHILDHRSSCSISFRGNTH